MKGGSNCIPPPGKTTLKMPSLIRVKRASKKNEDGKGRLKVLSYLPMYI